MESFRGGHIGGHITDGQLTDLMLGSASNEVKAHLKSCATCADEAAQFSFAVGSFEQESRIWAERQAATTPAVRPESQSSAGWLHIPAAWGAAAVAIAIGITLGVTHTGVHPDAQVAGSAATTAVASQVSADTLKADNKLLEAIDGKLRWSEPSSARAYGLKVRSNGTHGKGLERSSD
jgi:hypothetical protein